MTPVPDYSISVRNIVEFILRWGDINNVGMQSPPDMLEGTRIHRRLQKNEEKTGKYRSEVRLSETLPYEGFTLTVQGIADGIIDDENTVIDEIKSTSMPIASINDEYGRLHRAQVMCYAYIYAKQTGLTRISTRLTYFNIDTAEIRYITKEHTFAELEEFFTGLCGEYSKWLCWKTDAQNERNASAKALSFPYDGFRKGQREMAGSIYRTIRDRSTLYAQAPTGIGKTASVLFSAIKAQSERMGEKLFYLTAKTVTGKVAESALSLMHEKGLRLRSVFLCAKEKLCRYEKQCRPDNCPYAGGHFDRINGAVFDVLAHEYIITTEKINSYAEKHMVCPFELSLDVSTWCDAVVGDYNYAFDPRASLKRFFTEGGDYVLLCDEAHNLAERAREMFSAEILKSKVMETLKLFRNAVPSLYKVLSKTNKAILELSRSLQTEQSTVIEKPEKLYAAASDFCTAYSAFLGEDGCEDIKSASAELFFDCLYFMTVFEGLDENYRCCAEKSKRDMRIRLFCIDPSEKLSDVLDMCRAAVFFSATLLPIDYYREMTGMKRPEKKKIKTEESETPVKAPAIRLTSPFLRENLIVAVCPFIKTRYTQREKSYEPIAKLIREAVRKTGNYFVFFPSFAYMKSVSEIFSEEYPEIRAIIQRPSLTEEERSDFLAEFCEEPSETLVAFAVSGGIFSEGVDLTGSRLSGAIIVGVGLPQICFERDLIRDFYDGRAGCGYEYSYVFPGFNRVMQAAGRVIRSETDKGFVILADDRYATESYKRLFPPEWSHFKVAKSVPELKTLLYGYNGE